MNILEETKSVINCDLCEFNHVCLNEGDFNCFELNNRKLPEFIEVMREIVKAYDEDDNKSFRM